MGNTYGIKIKKIKDKSLLKDIVFSKGCKILEFVYYITKINKYFVENFRSGTIIREFTLYNIISKKEFNILIDCVEAGYFFEEIEYSLEEVPKLDKVLFISNVFENSISFSLGIEAQNFILLGNDIKYFNSISNVEDEVNSKNASFNFYDIKNDKIRNINFEEFRNENGELKMGFECEERFISEIFENGLKLENKNKPLIKNENYENKKSEDYYSKNLLEKTVNYFDNNICNDTPTDSNRHEICREYNEVKNIEITRMEKGNRTSVEFLTNDFEDKINTVQNGLDLQIENNNINDFVNLGSPYLIQSNKSLVSNSQENIESPFNHTRIDRSEVVNNEIEIKSDLNSNLDVEKKKNFKYSFTKIKKRYNKYLSIYNKVDSNFNFMNNFVIKKEDESSSLNSNQLTTQLEDSSSERNFQNNSNEPSMANKQKTVILIKGYYLTKNSNYTDNIWMKISQLHENTININ